MAGSAQGLRHPHPGIGLPDPGTAFFINTYEMMGAAGSKEEKVLINFQARASLKEEAEKAAERAGRSLSSYLRYALRQQLKAERGVYEENSRREAVTA